MVDQGEELLRLWEQDHLTEHQVDAEKWSLAHVIFIILFERAIFIHFIENEEELHKNNDADDEDENVYPGPESLKELNAHHFEHHEANHWLNENKEQVQY